MPVVYLKDPVNHRDVIENLILENGCKNVAEVGVWKGEMTKQILNSPAHKFIENYWSIDQWAAIEETGWGGWYRFHNIDWDAKYFKVCQLMRYFPALRVVRMPSVQAAAMFWKGYFDLVFLDACHWYDAVTADISAWLPLVKKEGILAGDDYGPVRHEDTKRWSRCEVKPAVDDYFGLDGVKTIQPHPNHEVNIPSEQPAGYPMVWYKRIGG